MHPSLGEKVEDPGAVLEAGLPLLASGLVPSWGAGPMSLRLGCGRAVCSPRKLPPSGQRDTRDSPHPGPMMLKD